MHTFRARIGWSTPKQNAIVVPSAGALPSEISIDRAIDFATLKLLSQVRRRATRSNRGTFRVAEFYSRSRVKPDIENHVSFCPPIVRSDAVQRSARTLARLARSHPRNSRQRRTQLSLPECLRSILICRRLSSSESARHSCLGESLGSGANARATSATVRALARLCRAYKANAAK
jgi:hypothetical protein